MSTAIKQGKKPLSSKPRPAPISADDVFINPLGVDSGLTAAIDKAGYSYRFINFRKWQDMGGSHPAQWTPITRKQLSEMGYGTMDTHDFLNGADPSGFIRRAELILAIRPKELNEKHKAYLRQEAQRGKGIQKRHSDELKEFVRSSGLNAVVHDGYQDDYEPSNDDDNDNE